ncbi:hypothetical protein PHISCL_03106 [Aspergillus sclerotialis]|uniref:TLC domain-containing protein n=1 Tax=Aspergillus sclerotialis TaxID=2070753 RepID=A0A3A3A3H1_9EURO|nr:hypothetical protein PHISCL_03106 [Aspergillus sclerotialis]
MLDPFPPPPDWLRSLIEPWALYFNLPGISDHIHEILLAFAFYQLIHSYLSPCLSSWLLPRFYNNFNRRTKLNWDVHVVSLVQSTLINAVALWVMFTDQERKSMTSSERVYGYTGGCGLILALATGYFVYDLIVSTIYMKIFGVGMFFHGVSALWVFSLGFRPFVNFYSPTFILYELSSPFLNIHWFLDKVNMTGSRAQWYNGMMLLFTFFSCRLIWGTWQSAAVYVDMFKALSQTWYSPSSISEVFQARASASLQCTDTSCLRANSEVHKFAAYTANGIPTWLVATYVASNLVLNGLNYFWFSKMIETVMKRFREPAPAEKEKKKKKEKEEEMLKLKEKIPRNAVLDAASKLQEEEGNMFAGDSDGQVPSGVDLGITDALRKRKAELASNVPLTP